MPSISDQEYLLSQQYRDASNLQARIDLHARFSTNPYGWFPWIFDHLRLGPQSRILEVGCGPGHLWAANRERIPAGWEITLSDFSEGMLEETRRNLRDSGHPFRFATLDVQEIPYPEASFDAVIANFMLYHVPNRPRALAELRRVLHPAGRLYAATIGAAHLGELYALASGRADDFGSRFPFNLENGYEQLAAWFPHVALYRYDDALLVTEAEPLIAYVLSTRRAADIPEARRTALAERVRAAIAEYGALRITKDSGLFEAWLDEGDGSALGS